MNPISSPKATSGSRMELGKSLVIEIRGIGHVPSFKTGKKATWSRNAQGRIIAQPVTKREHRAWMKQCVSSIVSELFSVLPTIGAAIQTGVQARSLIALLPPDDNWRVIPDLQVTSEKVEKGQEGFLIIIDRINPPTDE